MAFTRKPRSHNPDRHVNRTERLKPGQIMTDAEQRQIESIWQGKPSEVSVYKPGNPAFDALASIYQGTWKGTSECADFRMLVAR